MGKATTDDLLTALDYRLIDDAWDEEGRRTYLHDDEASRDQINSLSKILGSGGWSKDRGKLRSFHNSETREIIEVEPGGADTSGHLLHHMKASG